MFYFKCQVRTIYLKQGAAYVHLLIDICLEQQRGSVLFSNHTVKCQPVFLLLSTYAAKSTDHLAAATATGVQRHK